MLKSLSASFSAKKLTRSGAVALAAIGSLLSVQGAFAQSSTSAIAVEQAGNAGDPGVTLSQDWETTTATTTATQSWTGLDSSGNTQMMTFSGTTTATAGYSTYHVYTTGSLTNSYYNVNNPSWADSSGNIGNPNGSPIYLDSLGFAISNDTLQYGGVLEAGYTAQYIFHVDGTNSGSGGAADLDFTADGVSQGFFDFDNGYLNTTWATQGFAMNGVTPQQVNVQFSDQVVFNTPDITDGSNLSGTSDFGNTLTFEGIVMRDANGNIVDPSTWTVTSASGTDYARLNAVPEPATLPILIGLSGLLIASRFRRN